MKSLLVKLEVILIGFLIFGYAEVWGVDWKSCFSNDYETVYYDAENVVHTSQNLVRFLGKTVYTEKGASNVVKNVPEYKIPPSFLLTLNEMDCAEKKYRVLEMTIYSVDGKIIFSSKNPASQWIVIRPETVAQLLHEAVCK